MKALNSLKDKRNSALDFSYIDSNEKAMRLADQGFLAPLYLMPLQFNGEESARNRIYVPSVVVELRDRYDDMVEDLLAEEKVDGYRCYPEYKGDSFVPSKLKIEVTKGGEIIFSETIQIW